MTFPATCTASPGPAGATVESANGTLWELAHNSSTLTAIAAFDPAAQPLPNGGVTADADGNLYGTFAGLRDQAGNVQTHGGVWQFSPATGLLTTLATFDGTNGDAPNGDATIDAAGNLYGTAAAGGANDAGTVWELPAGATAILPLANFGGTVGTGPAGRLAVDATGNLFGTAQSGGANGYGTVWERPAGGGAADRARGVRHRRPWRQPGQRLGRRRGRPLLRRDRVGPAPAATASCSASTPTPPTDVTGVGGRATLTGGVTDPYLTVAADGTVYGASPTGGPDDRGEVFRLVPDVPAIQPIAANQTHGPNAPAGPAAGHRNRRPGRRRRHQRGRARRRQWRHDRPGRRRPVPRHGRVDRRGRQRPAARLFHRPLHGPRPPRSSTRSPARPAAPPRSARSSSASRTPTATC